MILEGSVGCSVVYDDIRLIRIRCACCVAVVLRIELQIESAASRTDSVSAVVTF
jgi:hypothetical protein